MEPEIPDLPAFLQKRINQKRLDEPERVVRLNNGQILREVTIKSIREIRNQYGGYRKVVLEVEAYVDEGVINLSFRSSDSNQIEAPKYLGGTKIYENSIAGY